MTYFSWAPRWGTAGLALHATLEEAQERAEHELGVVSDPGFPKRLRPVLAPDIKYGEVLGSVVDEGKGKYRLEGAE